MPKTTIKKNQSFDPSSRAIMDHLRRVVQVLRVASRNIERKAGVTGAQLFVLNKLADAGRHALSVNDLAERTLTHQSSVSVVVTKLVEQGLIERSLAEEDRRRWELSLTPKARALIRKAPPAPQDRIVVALSWMDPVRRAQLADLLSDLVEKIGAESAAPSMLFEPAAPANNVTAATEHPPAPAPPETSA